MYKFQNLFFPLIFAKDNNNKNFITQLLLKIKIFIKNIYNL